ncbi:hypothetical protein [Rhizobium rhizogenes]|uniref:hypothetical protein n=1 Tax=Rhizobium rhizogenes TaxID=359 RepID=UPI000A88AAB3
MYRAASAKVRFLGGFLSFARLIGRLHMGSDLQRFIVATSILMRAFSIIPRTERRSKPAARKAGPDDGTRNT